MYYTGVGQLVTRCIFTKLTTIAALLLISLTIQVVYSENIVPVTECGELDAPDTIYVLQNDITGSSQTGNFCIHLSGEGHYTFDLNGFTINSEKPVLGNCNNVKILNGVIIGGDPSIDFQEGVYCELKNIMIETDGTGIAAGYFSSSLFENVAVRNSINAISFGDPTTNVFMKNMTLTTNKDTSAAFQIYSANSVLTIENSEISGFTTNFLFNNARNIVIHTRNNKFDIKNIDQNSAIYGDVKIFSRHLVKLGIKNQTGSGILSSVEITDNGVLKNGNLEENIYKNGLNPTGHLTLGTDKYGNVETLINEKLTIITKPSELAFNEINLNPYTFTAGAGSVADTKTVSIESPMAVDFTLNMPTTNTVTLPICTVSKMLDLNNDGRVNLRDTTIIIAKFSGRNVAINGTKDCNALNFFPLLQGFTGMTAYYIL